jgi:glycosyltransferase involved in cell wall biosynthesis
MLVQQEYPQQLIISVLIPARSEARNLEYVLPKIPSIVSEVILIDGHSNDDTIVVAQQLLPGIRIVAQIGKGKGDAIRAGIAASTGDILVILDADSTDIRKQIIQNKTWPAIFAHNAISVSLNVWCELT